LTHISEIEARTRQNDFCGPRSSQGGCDSDVPGDPESLPVDVFQNTLSADYPELLAMSVIGEGFHDVAAGMHEILTWIQRQEN
jgi:hypothetical protein